MKKRQPRCGICHHADMDEMTPVRCKKGKKLRSKACKTFVNRSERRNKNLLARRRRMLKKEMVLEEIDLMKGDKKTHPDINTKDTYLCLIDGVLYQGQFNMQWYGLNFDGWSWNSLQYDRPGTNSSRWQRVWKLTWKKREQGKSR